MYGIKRIVHLKRFEFQVPIDDVICQCILSNCLANDASVILVSISVFSICIRLSLFYVLFVVI